jgi:hypothetical protein
MTVGLPSNNLNGLSSLSKKILVEDYQHFFGFIIVCG